MGSRSKYSLAVREIKVIMKILINLVTSIFLIILMALFDYNKINLIIYVILSILCLILNFSLKKYIERNSNLRKN